MMMFDTLWDSDYAQKGGSSMTGQPNGITLDERTTSLLQPDTLLPAEYFETFRRKVPIEPEKRLMLAVLQNGLQCFQKHAFAQRPKRRTLFQEALEWIVEEDSDWPFSFAAICETLGINPDYLRQELLRWRERRRGDLESPELFQLSRRRVQNGRRRVIPGPGNDGFSKRRVAG